MNIHDHIIFPKNSLVFTKDNFDKDFSTSVRKAINPTECPVKEKHIRRIVIGTHLLKSGQIFWLYTRNLDLCGNKIICWKFCHCLHKVLRDGHPKVIRDSFRHRTFLLDLGKMWGLLKQGYGKLIQNYCSLLVNKIDFHNRNPRFPGNLIITDNDLDRIGHDDVNVFFQLCCEMYDYMDEILCLQNNVYQSISSSMTSAGQCRTAPIILCIQDSSQLYDFTVKILFKLHHALPHTTLEGHRERFLNQFKLLKIFYSNYNRLQYFKDLVTIPDLPDQPPNFFVQSNLHSHITPIVVIPEQNEIEEEIVEDNNLLDLSFDDVNNGTNQIDQELVNWSIQDEEEANKIKLNEQNNIIEEKDRIIEKFSARISELELELQQLKFDSDKRIDDYKRKISELECAAAQRMEREVEQMKMELERQKSSEAEEHATKFTKLKEFYSEIRANHLELLKQKNENDKQLAAALKRLDEMKKEKDALTKQLADNSTRTLEIDSLKVAESQLKEKLSNVEQKYENTLIELKTLQSANDELVKKYQTLSNELEMSKKELDEQKSLASNQIANIHKEYFAILLNESIQISKRLIDEEMDLGLLSVNCGPQYFCTQIQILITKFNDYEQLLKLRCYSNELFSNAFHYYYQLFYLINCSKTTIRSITNIDLSQQLQDSCIEFIKLNSELIPLVLNNFDDDMNTFIKKIRNCLQNLYELTQKVLPELDKNQKNIDLETMLNNEMAQMDKTIQDAVIKIEQMLNTSNVQQSGIKVEVNGKILNACTALMQAIKQLILDSKHLQLEIASKQKGNFSIKEFYQRNHRWTEGLISAAKTVAADANLLVETADKIISGSGKFEELMAASQEIAASCAQLVVASRVKADQSSQNLSKLSKSSKCVLQETGNIIAITKHCSKLVEDNVETDFSKLTLHQAKRMEMECQVKVLELENALEKERLRLASIRRTHYHLSESLSNSDSN